MGARCSLISALMVLGLCSIAEPVEAEEGRSWTTPGWKAAQAEALAHTDRGPTIFQSFGATTSPLNTAARIESALLLTPIPEQTLVTVLGVRMATDDNRVAYQIRLPIMIRLRTNESHLSSGDLMFERHSLLATPRKGAFSVRTWRVVLPAATTEIRGHFLGFENLGGGVDWAHGTYRVLGSWQINYETSLGFRIDEEMPVRASAIAAAHLRLTGSISAFCQLNTELIAAPDVEDFASLIFGARAEIGGLEIVMGLMGSPGTNRRTLMLSVTAPEVRR